LPKGATYDKPTKQGMNEFQERDAKYGLEDTLYLYLFKGILMV